MVRLQSRIYLAYARLRRSMTLGVRVAVFDPAGRVFLIRHGYVPGWYFPGGGVEPGETFAAAMIRELMEEGCIRLDRPGELFGLYLNRAISRRDHVALYVVREWTQVRTPEPNLEVVESGLFEPGALPAGTTEATRRRLAEIAGDLPPAAEW